MCTKKGLYEILLCPLIELYCRRDMANRHDTQQKHHHTAHRISKNPNCCVLAKVLCNLNLSVQSFASRKCFSLEQHLMCVG